VMWDSDAAHTPIDLGVLPGDVSSTAIAANAAGQVVGISVSPTKERRAFLSQQGTMQDLASLVAAEDGVWTIQAVFAINNSGQIVAVGVNNGRAASILLTPIS
jgi:probable HAF family extracellular repeat protein